MCGVLLKVCRSSTCECESFGESVFEALQERGPDSLTEFREEVYSGVFTRLAIRSIQGGEQPFYFDSWITLINGELDNHREFLVDLNLEVEDDLALSGDMKVLAYAFTKVYGSALSLAEGMFAGIAINKKRKVVYAFRDWMGEKPLYYSLDDSHFIVSSIPVGTEQELILDTLQTKVALIKGYAEVGETIFRNVFSVKPAELIALDVRTWQLTFSKYRPKEEANTEITRINRTVPSLAFAVRKFNEALEKAVAFQIDNDVSSGILLSSGLDSSLIASFAMRIRPENIKAFTLGFQNTYYDESRKAREVAKALGIEHEVFIPTIEEFQKSVPKVLHSMKQPIFDPAVISFYSLSEHVAKEFKVAISGDGGDELLRGYALYKAAPIVRGVQKIAKRVPLALTILKGLAFSLRNLEGEKYTSTGMKLGRLISILENDEIDSAIVALSPISGVAELDYLFSFLPAEEHSGLLSDFVIDTHYRNKILPQVYLAKSDQMSMAHGLEIRSPFLSSNLWKTFFEYEEGMRHLSKRELLVQMMPKQVVSNIQLKVKHGFAPPLGKILENMYLSESVKEVLGLDDKSVARIRNQMLSGSQNYGIAYWALLIFDSFLARHRNT